MIVFFFCIFSITKWYGNLFVTLLRRKDDRSLSLKDKPIHHRRNEGGAKQKECFLCMKTRLSRTGGRNTFRVHLFPSLSWSVFPSSRLESLPSNLDISHHLSGGSTGLLFIQTPPNKKKNGIRRRKNLEICAHHGRHSRHSMETTYIYIAEEWQHSRIICCDCVYVSLFWPESTWSTRSRCGPCWPVSHRVQ